MEAEIASKELSLEEYIIREELRLSISNQMLKLSERDVIVLKAKYYHGCTTREICEMIGSRIRGYRTFYNIKGQKKIV